MGAIKPQKLLFISFLIWLFFFVQIEVEYQYEGSVLYPVITLFGFILFFVMGIISLKQHKVKVLPQSSDIRIKQITLILFLAGAIGVALKIYSGIFVTEIFTADDIFEKRLEKMGQELSGGILGVFASILFPFSIVAMLIGLYNYRIFSKSYLFVIILFGLFPFVETVFLGGRTIIALLGTTLIFTIYSSYHKNSRLKITQLVWHKVKVLAFPSFIRRKRVWIPLVIVGFVFVTYSLEVVNKRLERFSYGDKTLAIWQRTDYQWVKFDEDFKDEFYNGTKQERAKLLGYHSLKHYFSHGVIEYIRLVNHLEKSTGYYYGMYQFNVFFKFFKAFGIPLPSQAELSEIIKRQSVYRTFWGEFFIDFGIFGVIVMFFWGRFVKRIYTYAKRGHTPFVIFYAYLSTIIITSFFLNFLMGSSSYYLFAFIITLGLFRFWPEQLKVVYR